MIKNERRYKITGRRADEVRHALDELARAPLHEGLTPGIRELQIEALRGTLSDLDAELAKFDALRGAVLIEVDGIEQLPVALVQARIASGITQRQLAERVGLREQAVQRYEATDYAGAGFERLVEIAAALGLTIRCSIRLATTGDGTSIR